MSVKARLTIVAVCILGFPLLFSAETTSRQNHFSPLGGIAIAGHSLVGGSYCDCGGTDCICDSGEVPPGGNQGNSLRQNASSDRHPAKHQTGVEMDPLSGALLAGFTLVLLWLKMR